MTTRPKRYAPNTQKWVYTRYRKSDTCPFNTPDKFSTEANIVSRKDLFGKKPELLTSLVYQERIKAITRRLSLPTLSTTRKASLAYQKFENQDLNRVKYEKMFAGSSAVEQCHHEVMFTGPGVLRSPLTVGPDRGMPRAAAWMAESIGVPSRSLGVDTWHTRSLLPAAKWRSLSGDLASKARTDTSGLVAGRPRYLKGYSVHSGK